MRLRLAGDGGGNRFLALGFRMRIRAGGAAPTSSSLPPAALRCSSGEGEASARVRVDLLLCSRLGSAAWGLDRDAEPEPEGLGPGAGDAEAEAEVVVVVDKEEEEEEVRADEHPGKLARRGLAISTSCGRAEKSTVPPPKTRREADLDLRSRLLLPDDRAWRAPPALPPLPTPPTPPLPPRLAMVVSLGDGPGRGSDAVASLLGSSSRGPAGAGGARAGTKEVEVEGGVHGVMGVLAAKAMGSTSSEMMVVEGVERSERPSLDGDLGSAGWGATSSGIRRLRSG